MEVITSHSPAMQLVLEQVRLVAPTTTTVLLTGETGTGKGVIARLIHRHSMRGENQFLAAHCGAIPDTLIESELFGHEKGAFTGAHARKLGRFETAKGGTLFLDEIGTISPVAQIRLLEVLQDKTFLRVGGETPITADVRVIAATNIDLKKMVQAGSFRSDLYYRLNVFPIHIPPLRERVEDIALLVKSFLKRLNRQHLKEIHGLQPEVLEALKRYPWPGNIRELENLIERAYILEKGSTLGPEAFPAEIFAFDPTAAAEPKGAPPTLAEVRRRGLDQIERRYLREVLTTTAGRIDRAAAVAGLTPRQLHNLMTKHGLRKEEFRQPRTEGRDRFRLTAT
jgi:transcriptional regulator with GAF, ATPase, and Fis domain